MLPVGPITRRREVKSTSENTKLKPRLTAITNPNLKKICGGGEEEKRREERRVEKG